MFVLQNTDGRIKGVRAGINNCVRLFLDDDDFVDVPVTGVSEEEFGRSVRDVEPGVSDGFLKILYDFANGKRQVSDCGTGGLR